ncbi:class I SAM-dependent methyltransferase [Paenibacillus sp. IHBB 10380]|uniref:class I SAM-dependent methyltransferase n=1 Tax=Paenibacillus sp. IHBB 10380 TaxID=1566358 RepID=UPI0005CFDFFC|nr:class I SAM-dependent methyltransferase [Paenibacillus sp. IHBB 10380]AJS60488.1 SAM-dependent methyltransferase [Paenibacillus sp. IHBB 10380]
MNALEYKAFYDRIGAINGWDFSQLQCISEGLKWHFFNEVSQRCNKYDLLLDIGTGGGEALLSITDSALLLVGIDHSTGMITTANNNLMKSHITNVRFIHMDAEKLDFPDHFFNIVSCQHSHFDATEIARVLTPDGIFLTQQVSEQDKFNLKQAFGRGQAWGTEAGTLQRKYITDLQKAGFTDIQFLECNVVEYYPSVEDLVFLLSHTPIIPNFGEYDNDFDVLEQFITDQRTPAGIKTNSERFMIIAKK